MSEKPPIISKLLGSDLEGIDYITRGFEAEIWKEVHNTPEGQKSFIEKKPLTPEDLKHTLEVYRNFKNYNLPVVDFLKARKSKSKRFNITYSIVMEDLTQNGKFELPMKRSEFGTLINLAQDPDKMRHQMVQGLAVIHNNGYFDFHPLVGLGIAVRKNKHAEVGESRVDFKFLDYSNFRREDDGFPRPDNKVHMYSTKFNAAMMQENNIFELIYNRLKYSESSPKVLEELNEYYKRLRGEKLLRYDPELPLKL
jgi:hypothetical protein